MAADVESQIAQADSGSALNTGSDLNADSSSVTEPEPSSNKNIVAIDKALYLELIKLSRFNVRFHLEANAHQPWRSITYPLGRESGTAVAFAANLIDLRQQGKNLNHPAGISRNAVKDSIACGITGSAISGASSGLELAQNSWVMWKAKKNGFSPKESMQFVLDVVKTTDVLLDERERLIALETSVPRRRVRQLESALLKRIRQQLLFEFKTWSCHSRDQAWRENTFFAVDTAQSFLRMTASILARNALEDPDLAGSSIICAMVSNSVATINPIFRNLVGMAVRKHQSAKLAKAFPTERPDMPDGMSLEELKKLKASHPTEKDHEELLTSALVLSERSEKIDINLDRETKEVARYRQVAQQQSLSGPLIGLTGVTAATLSAVAFYDYRDEPKTALRLGFSGRIVSATGQAYALAITPYTVFSGMRRNKKLKERGQLPAQLMAERLKNLDRFEAQVRALEPEM
ncbi:MAG: hypothetical protein SGJ27_22825 [Candidatus Melainabacteria bacterium]|nr:hypothetical protein [Candidatus Melainabacteria bacterium]